MLHHKITKLDLEKLDTMSCEDLRRYHADMMNRVDHLNALVSEALELEQAITQHLNKRCADHTD
jgi:hypothetical protein